MNMNKYLDVNPEVAEALANGNFGIDVQILVHVQL